MSENNKEQKAVQKILPDECIIFIGMAASGKSTIGREFANLLGWPHVDTDYIIESVYAAPLQAIADSVDKESFLDIEAGVLSRLNLKKVVISTGGSAVYREYAMEHLKTIGKIIHIDVPLPIILERIARKPERGLAINPGQTIEDLYNERRALYEKHSHYTVQGGEDSALNYAQKIVDLLQIKS
ncbi:homoserine kinase [Desulfovibrio litoralis]|uniref:Shikimate kinase n=1 Tax=Desulfovibrio litoralis DSM 11393 TaxID=1121455 RepID=A0A1M7SGZ3_9BACT|nr:homoserine kinase [Desulfovibrio litoralis]SHN57766.1 shikimate kinase [Desulfovibrio litoralis DSM 11393]